MNTGNDSQSIIATARHIDTPLRLSKKGARMVCKECGSRVYEDGRFCPLCGANQTSVAAEPAALEDALIGTTIDNKYQIVSKIGTGSLGTVYRAVRTHIGDMVAIKVLRSDLVADQKSVDRFRRNAQAASRLKHPGLVTIYDFGVSRQGLVYVAMELLEGQSLRSLLDQQGPLTSPLILEIINQVSSALDAAHNQGIVHSDLRPERIVVSSTASGWLVKVLDFGIANLPEVSVNSEDTAQGRNVPWTPYYMSPEQCMGEDIDGRSDIYSLGIILYEMLCGVVPFSSPKMTVVIVQQVTQAPPPLRSMNSAIPMAVELVVQHAIEKQREARPQTAMAMAQELSAAMKRTGPIQPSVPPLLYSTRPQPLITNPVRLPDAISTETETSPTSRGLGLPSNVVFIKREEQSSETKHRSWLYVFAFLLLLALAGGGIAYLMRTPNDVNEAQANANQEQVTAEQQTENAGPVETANPPAAPLGMVFVSGGEFMMGSDTGSLSERPAHTVVVNPFFIDKHEVTCDEYAKFIRATNHPAPSGWVNGVYPAGGGRKPVTGVSWEDANAYAQWAGKRLPTEEEWEFAARGADGRRFPWGDQWASGVANADVTARGHHHVSNVGAHPKGPSPFGALDMIGNAWEWTSSDLTAYPGGELSEHTQPGHKVIRGGSFSTNRDQANTTFRKCYPGTAGDYSEIGFRCVQDLPNAQ